MNPNRLDPVLVLLTVLVLVFTAMMIACSFLLPNDGQTFQALANLDSGFAGALLMRVKPSKPGDPGDHEPGAGQTVKKTETSSVESVVVAPPPVSDV